jgi:cell division septation protein DedD
MDWLRRNWPDMAIGLALVAVIAGIVATLITGGSFFPVAPATPSIPPTVIAPLPSAPVGTTPAPLDAPPTSPGAVSVLTPDGRVVETTAPPAAIPPAGAATPAAATPTSNVTVLAPVTDPGPAPAVPPAAVAPAPAVPTPAPTPAATPAPVAAAPAAPTGLPAVSANDAAPYRVSVGAFGSPDNAARQAQTFRAAGYPVFTGTQGTLTIVLVGPYDTEAEANRVAAQIGAGGFGVAPVVYRFRPDAATPGASTPAPGAAAASAPPAAASTAAVPTTPAPAAASTPAVPTPAPPAAVPAPAAAPAIQTASSGRSLQVGAFADATSAGPLRERLASLGLVAFEVREDGLIKLLVGPFEAARLTEVRRQLAAVGIESFPR